MLPSILERAQIQSTESISVEKSIYNGFPFLESNKLWIASSSNPCEQCPPSATFCTISIRCWSGAALFDPTRSHTTTLQPTTTKKGVPFSTRGWPTGPWQWAARDISMWQVTARRATFLCFVDQYASLVKTASNSFTKIWVFNNSKA